MRKFVLDTNVILAFMRGHELYRRIEFDNGLDFPDAVIIYPIAVKVEILSIALQNNWKSAKNDKIEKMFEKRFVIHTNDVIAAVYVDIDTFSQGKHPKYNLTGSSRNMGKNDLWIASTAFAANATLITTDSDFDHLDNIFLKVIKYPIKI